MVKKLIPKALFKLKTDIYAAAKQSTLQVSCSGRLQCSYDTMRPNCLISELQKKISTLSMGLKKKSSHYADLGLMDLQDLNLS